MDLGLIDFIDIEGNLVIKDIKTIANATTVRWTPDNLVFYTDTNAKTLSGFVCIINFTWHFTDAYHTVLW